MIRIYRLTVLVAALASSLAVLVSAAGASVNKSPVKEHFEYDLVDDSSGTAVTYHFSCDETHAVASDGSASELIHCKTNDTSHKSAVVFTPQNLFGGLYPWFSDFTGEPATDFHIVGTPSGNLEGWATYAAPV